MKLSKKAATEIASLVNQIAVAKDVIADYEHKEAAPLNQYRIALFQQDIGEAHVALHDKYGIVLPNYDFWKNFGLKTAKRVIAETRTHPDVMARTALLMAQHTRHGS